jgi:hypothetical protein
LREGGRYTVSGTIVGANGRSPTVYHDLAEYDYIVFVGHWIQPQRFMTGPAPLSDGVLDEMFNEKDFLITAPWGIYNEVLEVFPRLAPGKCVLVCDPLSNMPELVKVPGKAKIRFLEKAATFCAARGIGFIFQPASTLDTNMVTDMKFNRRDGDFIHMNNRFWKLYLKKVRTYLDDHRDGFDSILPYKDEVKTKEEFNRIPHTAACIGKSVATNDHLKKLGYKLKKRYSRLLALFQYRSF